MTTLGGESLGTDFYLMDERLTEAEAEVRDRVRAFCDKDVIPVINDYWERAEFPFDLLPPMARLDIWGGSIKGYGCAGLSHLAAGLVQRELARGDGSISTFYGVHSGLAMRTIAMLGSEEQKAKWLPPMARLEKIGAFALTEPEHGSDAVRLEARARREGDDYVIDGAKRWIGNASIADVTIVWARDDDDEVGAFLVPKGAKGFETRVIPFKTSKRAVWQADITLAGVRVKAEERLAGSRSFKDTNRVLISARSGVAWGALGHAIAAYESALEYCRMRVQFSQPLIAFQIVQQRLARMLADLTSMQLICFRLSELAAEQKLTSGMASLAKMHNAARGRAVTSEARDLLGGNGILLDYHVARHHADMESVVTYEGTDTIQSLIVGREISGIPAFAPGLASDPNAPMPSEHHAR
jgi:glutaryl-CoA dehydrogenase